MGPIVLGSNHSHIYLNMCATFGGDLTVVSGKKGGYRQTHKGMPQLYIVDCIADREQLGQQMLNEQTNESTEYLSASVP